MRSTVEGCESREMRTLRGSRLAIPSERALGLSCIVPGCRAPIPSKCKQEIGAVVYRNVKLAVAQVFTGDVPFRPHGTFAAAMLAVLDKERPARPTHPNLTTDELWELMTSMSKRCWDQEPYGHP
ncbi:hypothetical protein BDM02DRAFT_894802 [Thelephora ganbajun]|uniref:Uncharacterized protein n=1 Tax=Thelephora ganbajun TaxID=370292 RepID=A0ACB6Z4B6_THEGA|nr:hypothetical protein BDM02DRAFT_894802 [Thelephora ganbajun]